MASGNDQLFYRWPGNLGMGPSHRDLAELLDRLEKDELVATEKVGNLRVVKVPRAHVEIAVGRTTVD